MLGTDFLGLDRRESARPDDPLRAWSSSPRRSSHCSSSGSWRRPSRSSTSTRTPMSPSRWRSLSGEPAGQRGRHPAHLALPAPAARGCARQRGPPGDGRHLQPRLRRLGPSRDRLARLVVGAAALGVHRRCAQRSVRRPEVDGHRRRPVPGPCAAPPRLQRVGDERPRAPARPGREGLRHRRQGRAPAAVPLPRLRSAAPRA
ncbi:hypothetical protein G5V59_21635 [Nocardioides sp. W3-2-3]|uniref:hypothetical protein n=1 Tax=Nocardioides convexus TaxID=2712224 RepID=UPI0024185249|nr:hypothetical protein [Nocardioides convexus]NHA01521.1 hypothetical protein [Nocardioides convexus]